MAKASAKSATAIQAVKSPAAGPRSESIARGHRVAGVSGSAALIGVLQTIPNPTAKAVLSCVAPCAIEIFIYLYGISTHRLVAYINRREEQSNRKQAKIDLSQKLQDLDALLKILSDSPLLEDEARKQLLDEIAQTQKALLQKEIHDVQPRAEAATINTIDSSEPTQGNPSSA